MKQNKILKRSITALFVCSFCFASAASAATNLLVNGSFETGDTSGWIVTGGGGVNTFFVAPEDGNQEFRLQDTTGKGLATQLTQTVNLGAGDYTLSMWVASRPGSYNLAPASGMIFNLFAGDTSGGAGQNILTSSSPDYNDSGVIGTYVEWTRTYTLAAGDYTLVMNTGINMNSGAQYNQGQVDNFQLVSAIPEPSTTLLGVIGMFALLHRRRVR
jgi:hypothetical protein